MSKKLYCNPNNNYDDYFFKSFIFALQTNVVIKYVF